MDEDFSSTSQAIDQLNRVDFVFLVHVQINPMEKKTRENFV